MWQNFNIAKLSRISNQLKKHSNRIKESTATKQYIWGHINYHKDEKYFITIDQRNIVN